MSDLAIWTKGLGKRYHIGERRSVKTLSETLNGMISRPFRREKSSQPELAKPFWALRDVSFEVNQGDVLGIIGRNGSGKSTLLKILSRITRPTEGELEVRGRIRPLLEVGVGFHPELTGRENVYLNGSLMGMRRVDIERQFDEIVAFSGIEDFIDTPVKFYSSGMYVRLAFATSVHLEPDIILIDEVLAVGDVEFQKKCLKKIDQIRRQGRTILLVSHAVSQLAELASHVIWLEAGRVVEQGHPRDIISNYLSNGSVSASMLPPETTISSDEKHETKVENRIPVGGAVFDPPQGSDGIQVLRTYITNEKSQVVGQTPYELPFCLVAEYEADRVVGGMRVGFKLYNERDQVVMHVASCDGLTTSNDLVVVPGHHRASIQIPGAWFTPGRYYVELGIWSPGVGHHFTKSNAFSFDIGNAPLESVGYEILRPILNWDITQLSETSQV